MTCLESSLLDIAIEHRGYLYSQNVSSTIICRSRTSTQPELQSIELDQGCKTNTTTRKVIFSSFLSKGKRGPRMFYVCSHIQLYLLEKNLFNSV